MIRFPTWITSALLAFSVTSAWADDAPQPSIDALRLEAYRAIADAGRLRDDDRVPEAVRVNLYLRQAGLSRRLIRRIEWQIDDQPPAARDLDEAEATALADHNDAVRLTRIALPEGRHRLRAELLLAAVAAGKPDAQRVRVDQLLDKTAGPVDYDLRLDTGTVGSPVLKLRLLQLDRSTARSVLGVPLDAVKRPLLADGRYRRGDDADPALATARSLARVGLQDAALIELLAMEPRTGDGGRLASDYWLSTAATMRALGLLESAQAICDRLAAGNVAIAEVATERLHLAEARFSIGELDGAAALLESARSALPEYRQADWRQTRGLVQLARQNAADASKTLQAANTESIDAFRYMNASVDAQRATAYTRYNLAIAMIRDGDEKRGLSWLDLIGRSTTADPELLALRDKANVALGWHFLRQKQGRTALGALGRVRSEGLSSNSALLGMGWAQLAPNGERLSRIVIGRENARAPDQLDDLPAPLRNSLTRLKVLEPELGGKVGPRSFERDDPPKNRMDGLRRALVVWKVLLDRDPRDPAVQEAWLATAYAQDQLRDVDAARRSYAMAIATLRDVETEIGNSANFVRSGSLVKALRDSSDADDLTILSDRLHLIPDSATLPVYSAVAEQQALARLIAMMTEADRELTTVTGDEARNVQERLAALKSRIAQHQVASADSLQAMALKHLDARRDRVHGYLRSALLLAARAEEQPQLDARDGGVACSEGCR